MRLPVFPARRSERGGRRRAIVIHAGATKTGTSAIQTWLARNHAMLQAHGILYPPPRRGFEKAAAGRITSGNAEAMGLFVHPERRPAHFSESAYLSDLAALLRGEFATLLFSSEGIDRGDPEKLKQLAAFFRDQDCDVTVLYAVRNIADHAFSVWGQSVKRHGNSAAWKLASRKYRAPFRPMLEALSDAFGREAIRVVNYERHKSDIVGTMLSGILPVGPQDVRVEPVNRSLSAFEIELMREYNREVRAHVSDRRTRERLATQMSDFLVYNYAPPPLRVHLDAEQLRMLQDSAGADVDYVNAHFLPREPIAIAGAEALAAAAPEAELDAAERGAMRILAERAAQGALDLGRAEGDCRQDLIRAARAGVAGVSARAAKEPMDGGALRALQNGIAFCQAIGDLDEARALEETLSANGPDAAELARTRKRDARNGGGRRSGEGRRRRRAAE